ncbi:hypothetical protein OAP56_02375 [Rickettsiaceae bacterium]|nr:hypothetical protein [Rickettsiaceae bacterium]
MKMNILIGLERYEEGEKFGQRMARKHSENEDIVALNKMIQNKGTSSVHHENNHQMQPFPEPEKCLDYNNNTNESIDFSVRSDAKKTPRIFISPLNTKIHPCDISFINKHPVILGGDNNPEEFGKMEGI